MIHESDGAMLRPVAGSDLGSVHDLYSALATFTHYPRSASATGCSRTVTAIAADDEGRHGQSAGRPGVPLVAPPN